MENNKKDPNELVQGWLDEILSKLDIPESNTFGTDEQAAASAGLTHPDDMELERIVQETIAENWTCTRRKFSLLSLRSRNSFYRIQK